MDATAPRVQLPCRLSAARQARQARAIMRGLQDSGRAPLLRDGRQNDVRRRQMIFHETTLKDAMLIDLEKRGDDRGFFARTYCQREFSAHVLDINYTQQNTSSSKYKGTLRGMHFQKA